MKHPRKSTSARLVHYLAVLLLFVVGYFLISGRKREQQLARTSSWRNLVLLILFFVAVGIGLYSYAVMPQYSVPSDPIYLTIGPTEDQSDSIQVSNFRFIAYPNQNYIGIMGYVSFMNKTKPHHLDFYLPFVVTEVRNNTATELRASHYVDSVDRTCSLVHLDVPRSESWNHYVDFDIIVTRLVSVERFGEKTMILTFGPPHSRQFESLMKHFGERRVEIARLTTLFVTISAGRRSFFSSDTYPVPDVEYLTDVSRYATWFLEFRGLYENWYRSIHCTMKDVDMMQTREFLILVSGVLLGLSASLFVEMLVRRRD